MDHLRLRPVSSTDVAVLTGNFTEEGDPWNFFGFRASNSLERRLAADGLLSDGAGTLVVELEDGTLIGEVGWHAVQHGPSAACRALNIGIALLPEHRGKGYGSAAQGLLAAYLFRTTLVERLEAGTDVENLAEQRALEKAGFLREGVLRHAQFRGGLWRDVAQYSRLRGDARPDEPGRVPR